MGLKPRRPSRRLRALGIILGSCALLPGQAGAQIQWRDLVITSGLSGEGYSGNLPAVTIPAVDSTRRASAAVGEIGFRGGLSSGPERTLSLRVDAGLRQFSAFGFKVRDYAPREWVGRADLIFRRLLPSRGELLVQGGLAGRRVQDRPPMPLYIQPGYRSVNGGVRIQRWPVGRTYLDAEIRAEVDDYPVNALNPQMDLLDRKMAAVETGVTWGEGWTLRAHAVFGLSIYDNQATFDPGDPTRMDRTMTVGATWTKQSGMLVRLRVDGTVNRSNSRRPEYDAFNVSAVVSAPLVQDVSLTFFASLTDKRYVTETDYARLVPGEEADNASVVYLELARPMMVNLDGAIRLGWTRAETDIGDSYFERYGLSLLLRYRPWDN
jgi:hypothetical protein